MQPLSTTTTTVTNKNEKVKAVLPVEMASMVPLRTLVGKLIHKAHADLMTLTDTLPSMSDVEKKRQILTYITLVKKQFSKLLVLVKWAKDANDVQMCQNIMAFLANQNKFFQDTVDYLHKIHTELPAARVREFDILTAVDVLTTGTYQRMPTKIKDMLPPDPLTDEQVLETFQSMNDVIRMRMLTSEVLPSPIQTYRIENGRIYFSIKNEFEVALTLMGHSNDRKWWIVSLNVLVKATTGGGAGDIDVSLNDAQKQHLRNNAQQQLAPPPVEEDSSLFFPLVNMYDYLHLFCLNMQLEMLYMQSVLLAKTRWTDQLKVQMDQTRTKLVLVYWAGGSPASKWARPFDQQIDKSTMIDIFVSEDTGAFNVRDEFKGLIQKAGIGASIQLSGLDNAEKSKAVSALKYPKNQLKVFWGGSDKLYTKTKLLDSSNLSAEQLLLHVTSYHGKCIIRKFRETLESQQKFLEENGLHLADAHKEGLIINDSQSPSDDEPSLIVRYRHQRYVSIESDSRTGRIKAFETGGGCSEGDGKLRGLEERLNNDPENIAKHLLWLRSEVVIREVISLAKQLNLQPYHPSQMNLRPDDVIKLFGDLTNSTTKSEYPPHCVFLQFSQFEDWYFVVATVKNEFLSWLCCFNKTYDQNSLYQVIVDMIYVDCEQMWRDQFMDHDQLPERLESKRRKLSTTNDYAEQIGFHDIFNAIDNLSMDLRYLAKLDSLCRAYITNRKIELQLQSYKGSLKYHMRPLLESLSSVELQTINHPAADKMEVVCVPQRDLLKICAYHYHEKTPNKTNSNNQQQANQQANQQQQQQPPQNDKINEPIAWIEKILPHMTNDVMIRSSGWWDCGKSECYVVIQDKFEWNHINLQNSEIGDHISLDKTTRVISFTYTDIDNAVDHFLMDWERVFMMVNISRQVSSTWFEKYKDQLEFNPTNLQELSFTYAKDFTCAIKWEPAAKESSRQYNIELGVLDGTKKTKSTSLPTSKSRNPHWRVTSFLRDTLNERRDLIYFVQILFQTLPLMACLELLETNCVQEGNIGNISIIPRAVDSVRVVFSAMHAVDIRFTDAVTICVSDAAYYHKFYNHSTIKKNNSFIAPQPYLVPLQQQQQQQNGQLKPIKVAQQFNFVPFAQFSGLLETIDSWIFPDKDINDDNNQPWYVAGEPWADDSEPNAISFQHGLLCSASLCRGILYKLQATM